MTEGKKFYRLKEGKRHRMRPGSGRIVGGLSGSKLLTDIYPGQVIELTDQQFINFRDKFDGPLDYDEEDANDRLAEKLETSQKLEVRHAGGGWYDVVDENGDPINDKKLRKDAAEQLAAASESV